MSDSVGKISLDLEVQSDISKQISSVSNAIASNLKKNLNNSIKSTLESANTSTKKTLNNITSNLNNTMEKSANNIKKVMRSILSSIKIPKVENPKPTNTFKPKVSEAVTSVGKRGPPVNVESLKDAKLGKINSLDITDRQIENLRNKLKILKDQLNNTFNAERRNKLENTILSTESRMDSLINKSIRLSNEVTELNRKISNTVSGNGQLNTSSKNVNSGMKGLNSSVKSARSGLSNYNNGIVGSIKMMFKWMIILPMIVKGLTAMARGVYNNLMTNEQFSNSLAQIKSNLMIAFTPIYNFILPAINALMSALSVATQYIASFISAIFGKTFNQSKQATQGLIDAKEAMGAYGDSAKAAGKAAKDALGLAGIDEINTLGSSNDSADSGGGGGSKVPQLVAPALDTTSVDSAMKKVTDKIKAYFATFNFEPLIQSFDKVKSAVEPIVNNLGKIIKWFLVEILDPLAHWTISDLLPAFLNLLAGALKVLNPILEIFMSLGAWLWDSFLQQIASWTGGVVVSVLNGLADMLSSIGTWISEHKPLIEDLILVIGSFALAWGLVTGAMNLWNIAVGIWNSIGAIATAVTTGFGAAVAFLTSPITLVILAIGSLIAIGVLLYKHWDVVKAKAIEVWDFIKNKFIAFSDWMDSIFLTDWSKQFGFLGDIMNGLLQPVRSVWESVKQIFRGVVDFIEGAFSNDWSRAFKGLVNIFGGIMSGMAGVMKLPLNAVIGLINGAINGLNKISVNIPSWIPGIGGKSFGVNIPNIPYLAKGGIIDTPTLAMVGEAGKEAVVPLENNKGGLRELASILLTEMGQGNSNSNDSFGEGDLILQIDGSVIGKVALKQLRKMQRQGNITLIPV